MSTNELPLLMNAEMVRATLDGRKTNTRRPVKPQPIKQHHIGQVRRLGEVRDWAVLTHYANLVEWIKCPFGKPGDELWVREPTRKSEKVINAGVYVADQGATGSLLIRDEKGIADWWYSKDCCPSIHMPRWASRIQLKVLRVWVERVQDISEEDAKAEGCGPLVCHCGEEVDTHGWHSGHSPVVMNSYRDDFQWLWDSIYSEEYPWESNPWAWACEFEVIRP